MAVPAIAAAAKALAALSKAKKLAAASGSGNGAKAFFKGAALLGVGCILLPMIAFMGAAMFLLAGITPVVANVAANTAPAIACGGGPVTQNAYAAAFIAYGAGFRNTSANRNALTTAVAIAGAASGWNPAAPDQTNSPGGPTATIDRGEWQIESIYANGDPPVFGGVWYQGMPASLQLADWTNLTEPDYNAQSFYYLYTHNGNNSFNWPGDDEYLGAQYLAPQNWNMAARAVALFLTYKSGGNPASVCPSTSPATACGGGAPATAAYAAAILAQQAGFTNTANNDLSTAVAIAGAESGWNPSPPDNTNPPGPPTGTIDRGEWQIESVNAFGPPPVFGGTPLPPAAPSAPILFDWSALNEPIYNAGAFYDLWLQNFLSFDFNDQYTSGTYRAAQFWNTADQAVKILLAVQAGRPASSACPPPPTTVPISCPGRMLVTTGWGDSGWGYYHTGIDLVCPALTPIVSVGSGRVVLAYQDWAYTGFFAGDCGGRVDIQMDAGYLLLYDHLQEYDVQVSVGRRVNAGDLLGHEGNNITWGNCATGPHLHFQKNTGSWTPGNNPCSVLPPSGYLVDGFNVSPVCADLPWRNTYGYPMR